jgi:hypothetical protein
METGMSQQKTERRQTYRRRRTEEHGIVSTRVRPGHDATLVDVSAGGALIDTNLRLLPGAAVELQVDTGTTRASVRGRVLRSAVVRVHASAVCYRGAIGFDAYLPWFAGDAGSAPCSSEARAARPERGDDTRKVI